MRAAIHAALFILTTHGRNFGAMFTRIFFIASVFVLCSCKQKPTTVPATTAVSTSTESEEPKQGFFPVNSFIRGEINGLRTQGINPIEYRIYGEKKDSSWLQSENFEKSMIAFLEPSIDSISLSSWFSESSFLDQTINAVTFSYDPKTELPDSFPIRRWDVYIDPATEKVRRIYIVKKLLSGNVQQLTWQAGHWAKILELDPSKTGNSAVIRLTEIKWDY